MPGKVGRGGEGGEDQEAVGGEVGERKGIEELSMVPPESSLLT